jgi:hypothetical protein
MQKDRQSPLSWLVKGSNRTVPLLEYRAEQENLYEFEFIFPRRHKGRPILSAQDRFFKLTFTCPERDDWSYTGMDLVIHRASIEFKVNKVLINGNVVY